MQQPCGILVHTPTCCSAHGNALCSGAPHHSSTPLPRSRCHTCCGYSDQPLLCCRDNHMRLWNLVKGRCQYTSALQQEAELVRFSPSGEVRH